ncbi:PTS glucitol/sorbitol transporter subunit IIA [Selenomonas timonae]|uniref:PTS glucitol/sorbitol transporter subunit IIA n=1 Tax=Selenomonas timonae TaxID=2754044 RepID=A0A7G7VLV4_9FIRM|nr:PTS glucitol/sorbitol transporter subunit IIA [Selenomonas timonae]QNH55097.1 PTS glucitol/sorbitol transporter subunit IIA [Selenomonas timonae]
MKYEVTVTGIGDFVLPFMRTRESVIIFDKDVPYEYENMVVAHTKAEVKADIVVGDTLHLADRSYTVTAVGDEAMKTLREHGHCTIVFTGKDAAEQPGQIMVKGDGVPRFMVGDIIRFE